MLLTNQLQLQPINNNNNELLLIFMFIIDRQEEGPGPNLVNKVFIFNSLIYFIHGVSRKPASLEMCENSGLACCSLMCLSVKQLLFLIGV